MRSTRILFVAARLCFALFVLMTSVYALLTHIPFTYFNFLKYLSWLPVFVKLHPYLFWMALGILTPTLVPDLRRKETRRLTLEFLFVHFLAGVWFLFRPLLSGLDNDNISFIWSVVALFPLFWLAIIDFVGCRKAIEWPNGNCETDRRIFRPAILSALFLSLLFVGFFYLRSAGGVDLRPAEIAAALSSTLASHLLIFVMLYVALWIVRAVAFRFRSNSKIEFCAFYLLVAIVGMLVIRRVVLPTIALSNYLADVFSIAASGSVVAFLVGLRMRLYRRGRVEFNTGLEMALLPLTPALPSKVVSISLLLMIGSLGYVVPANLARADWDFLLQKLSVIGIWSATFVIFYSMQSRVPRKKRSLAVVALVVVATLGAYKAMGQFESRVAGLFKEANIADTLERYSGNDISFKVAREILSPATDDDAFYSFLRKAAQMSPSTHATLANVSFTDELKATQGAKPNIFIFVIDSLRRDYLSTYNSAVDFTPSIASFARESVVIENAFTRYSGTALAEPSIWIGGMLLHAHANGQVLYEMNALQKLVEAEGYQSFISIDRILTPMVRPSSSIVQLDKELGVGDRVDRRDYIMAEFSRTVKELETRLDERADRSRPVFAYSQPQNLHLLMTYKKDVPAGEEYAPAFYAPYASRLKRVDACFGEFLDYLKAQGMYDNSIVILTSDHGDEHGEGGRWGHAYWLFPDIIRIPLIIHLPSELRNKFHWSSQPIAFSVDITPSLYYLLGHKPTMHNKNFGRPLFTSTQEEQTAYLQESYLLVSSYAPVFGILGNKGRSLYIANAVDNRDSFFDLQDDPAGVHNRVTARLRAENQKLIHDGILSIQQFYNQGPGAAVQSATNCGNE
jgi:hypothetical protein